jgi:hypothetical protein
LPSKRVAAGSTIFLIAIAIGCYPGRSLVLTLYSAERRSSLILGGGSLASSSKGAIGAMRNTPRILYMALFWIAWIGVIERLLFHHTSDP